MIYRQAVPSIIMKCLHYIAINCAILFYCINIYCQSAQPGRLFIPFLDKESQTNVIVTVSDLFGSGETCPHIYTNVLSNTNLFSFGDQRLINGLFLKYKNVTTNLGPPGTELVSLYQTNYAIKAMGRTVAVQNWMARFQYTNSEDHEEITFCSGILAKFRNKYNAGYNLSIGRTGDGSWLRIANVKNDLINGLVATFVDSHSQGATWEYRFADFKNCRLGEYRQYTNGLAIGKYLMWNVKTGNLILDAMFKEPYDIEKHRSQVP